jgi:hypothetical protein
METKPALTLSARLPLPSQLTDCVLIGHGHKADVIFTPRQWFAMCAHMMNENPDAEHQSLPERMLSLVRITDAAKATKRIMRSPCWARPTRIFHKESWQQKQWEFVRSLLIPIWCSIST